MCASRDSPSLPPSDTESASESDSSTDSDPPYTPKELAAIFLDFYTFLTTLHYNAADLKIPPPGGWPGFTQDLCEGFKTDFAIEVLRRLPYFDSKEFIHYKSRVADFTSYTREDFERGNDQEEDLEFWCDEGEIVDPIHVLCIANGRESNGRQLFLDVKHGEITEDMIRAQQISSVNVESFFENLKEEYRSLKLIPCPGRITIEADRVDERDDEITEEQVRAQTEEWGTDLDVQYIRQIYRQHGWPNTFRRDDALRAVDELSDSIEEQRGSWAKTPSDWDQGGW